MDRLARYFRNSPLLDILKVRQPYLLQGPWKTVHLFNSILYHAKKYSARFGVLRRWLGTAVNQIAQEIDCSRFELESVL